jgi:hypothetical protein
MGEDRHEKDGVGDEMVKLEAELLQEKKEEGGERRDQPAHGVRVEENELPAARSWRGILSALIFLAFAGEVHPTRRRTRSSWA